MTVHRRNVLKGAAALPLSAILADASITAAVAAGLDTVAIKTAGGRSVSAALALPAAQKAPAVVLIHEWWGLNDQIKAVAADYARAGYVALAIDLYGGKVGKTPGEAQALMRASMKDPKAGFETCGAWIDWLKQHARSTGKVGTVGWCFGGGWSLNASIARPVDATVIYYGHVLRGVDQLKKLKGPGDGAFRQKGPVHRREDGRRLREDDGRRRQEGFAPGLLVRRGPRLRQPVRGPVRRSGLQTCLGAYSRFLQEDPEVAAKR